MKEFSLPEAEEFPLEEQFRNRIQAVFMAFAAYELDARLVGSLGRAAAIGQPPLTLIRDGGYRDIDIVILNQSDQDKIQTVLAEANQSAQPLQLEEHFKTKILIDQNGTSIRYKDIILPVHPEVFQIVTGELYGVPVPTFNPMTHFHLPPLYGPFRVKDFHSVVEYGRTIRNRDDLIDDKLFEPFHQLGRLRQQTYPMDTILGNARWEYHQHVPYKVRTSLSPVVRTPKNLVSKTFGWIEGFK